MNMNEQEINLETMRDIVDAMIRQLKEIRHEIPRLITNCDHLRSGLDEGMRLLSERTVDPLKAPEVDYTDRDGNPDSRVVARRDRIELDE